MVNKPNIFGGNETQWAGSRERTSILRSRRSFFLDIPFYRTHLALPEALECYGLLATVDSESLAQVLFRHSIKRQVEIKDIDTPLAEKTELAILRILRDQ
jgi:hypothetical protein